MKERGVLLFSEEYEHRYPHCWRCHNPVIFRATPQWFIAMDHAHRSLVEKDLEKDEDGRDRSNFTDNLPEDPAASLRASALSEIERVNWIPGWGVDRMRNMLKGRPDWCVSRQRVWGVSIPVFYCAKCTAAVADPKVINHVADIFEKESGDAWYTRDAQELLPAGYTCTACGADEWTKETDILDVWFDSGVSSIAVLDSDNSLRWPADVYIEGGDQFRGWFNSSLMVGLAAHDRAPYKSVITHGWTLDSQGRAMHKSLGNAIDPNEVIKQSGAEIIRLWCASSNYFDDLRASDEILQRVTDGYRKIRNTARFALGNLHGFDPERDSVPDADLEEIDRWALAELDRVVEAALAAYQSYEFHSVYRAIYGFTTVTLSARYFDIIKDHLYTYAPHNKQRRSAQTALFRIVDVLARLLAPILVFTADEIWENIPGRKESEQSVHVALFPQPEGRSHEELLGNWNRLFTLRDEVLRVLEEARIAKQIGSSLEAKVILAAGKEDREFLSKYAGELRYLFIVSQVEITDADGKAIGITVVPADGEKCERCWNYSTRVGESEKYPTVCERCVAALDELEKDPTVV